MSNAAKTGLALVIIIAVIVVGLIWYMGSPSASTGGLAARPLGQVAANSSGSSSISADLSSIDASMAALSADSKDMDSFSI